MELFFGSHKISGGNVASGNLVAFSIPDLGVKFKAPYAADNKVLDYAALLTLLEFIEINPQLFTNRALELYCNNYDLVSQVKNSRVEDIELAPFLRKALEYRNKLRFSLNWIPAPDNPAQNLEIN